ncbi:MAG: hypothetical protein DRP11_01060 [Candidatus Aenigmatarchaeota archaeon]|nr:MAG: hypothetical protein DRP11_01060 [Candidatus Aenigmarchaeota archaeon]
MESIPVEKVMTKNVITINPESSALDAAELMKENNIGSVVVVDKENHPIGILTTTDLMKRVTAENLRASDVKISDIMSKGIKTTAPDEELNEVSRRMSREGIKRLPVVKDGKLVGLITYRDILRISPEVIDILKEKMNEKEGPNYEGLLSDVCEVCGNYSEELVMVDGKWVCENCRDDV